MSIKSLVFVLLFTFSLGILTGCDNSSNGLPSQADQVSVNEPVNDGEKVDDETDKGRDSDGGVIVDTDEEPDTDDGGSNNGGEQEVILVHLSVQPDNSTIATNEQVNFQATASYSDDSTSIVTDEVVWESDDSNLISILDSGLGTAISAGSTFIRATLTKNGVTKSSEVAVTITGPTLMSITVSPKKFLLPASVKKPLTAIAQYSDGTTEDITDKVTWSASETTLNNPNPPAGSDPIFVTVDTNGVVFCDEFDNDDDLDNDTTITATYQGMQDTAQLTVFGSDVGPINVTPTFITLEKGNTQQFTATALLSMQGFISSTNVTQIMEGERYSSWGWSSSDPSVVSIDRLTGLATVLTATDIPVEIIFERLEKQGVAMLQIKSASLESIIIEPLDSNLIQGVTESVQVLASYSDGTTKDISAQQSLILSSSDANIIDITEGNELYANQAGTASLVASFDGVSSDSVEVVVESVPVESISVEPSSLSLAKGTVGQLTASATYSDGSTRDITDEASWMTKESDAVSVNSSGKVMTNAMPTNTNSVTVTATYRGHQATSDITVKDVAPQSITATLDSTELSVGEKGKITITATFSDGSNQDVTELAFVASLFPQLSVTPEGVIDAWLDGDFFLVYGYGFSYGYTRPSDPGFYEGIAYGYDYGYDVVLPTGGPTPFGSTETISIE